MDFEGSSWSRSRPAALYWDISSGVRLSGFVDAAGSEDGSGAGSDAGSLDSSSKSTWGEERRLRFLEVLG
jgi:hypothetical protein